MALWGHLVSPQFSLFTKTYIKFDFDKEIFVNRLKYTCEMLQNLYREV